MENGPYKFFEIRFDADKPLHMATLNVYFMITELTGVEIHCHPLDNCVKSINEFFRNYAPGEKYDSSKFEFPVVVYTSSEGTKKVKYGETWTLQVLLKRTHLILHGSDFKCFELAREIRELMTELSKHLFNECLENQLKEIIMVNKDHKAKLDKILNQLDKQLLVNGIDFLAGNALTIADVVVICELFPSFAKLETSVVRDGILRRYNNVICWLKRLNGIYSIPYVLRKPVDLYPNEEFTPERLVSPMQPAKGPLCQL